MPRHTRYVRLSLVLAALVVPAACGPEHATTPGGGAEFDAVRVRADARAMSDALGAPVLASFAALAERLALGPAPAASVAVPGALLEGGERPMAGQRAVSAVAERLLSAVNSDASPEASVLRPDVLGTTLVYDPAHSTGASGSTQQVDLVVRSADAAIRYALAADEHTVNATVFVNERVFATITGDHRRPDVRGAGGGPLHPDEVDALRQLLGLADGAFRLFADVLRPVAAIFALSAIP